MTESRFWRIFFILTVCACGLFVLFRVWNIVIPFILGLAISYLIYPVVDSFVILGLRRDRIVLVLYAALLAVFFLTVFFVFPRIYRETNSFLRELPKYAEILDQTIQHISQHIQIKLVGIFGSKAEAFSIPFNTGKFVDDALRTIPKNLLNVAHGMAWVIIIPFVCFFALTQGKSWIDFIFQWTPSAHVENLLGLSAEINAALGGYIRGQLLDALCVGVLTSLGLSVLGIDGAIVIGCLTGLFNVVPFMAPVVGGSIALFVGLVQQQSSTVLMGIVALYIGIRMFDDFIFIPFVLGHSVSLHPIIMLFAVLAGFELAGLMGLVFSIPMAAVIKVVISVLFRGRETTALGNAHIY